jgi:hypothetical protein
MAVEGPIPRVAGVKGGDNGAVGWHERRAGMRVIVAPARREQGRRLALRPLQERQNRIGSTWPYESSRHQRHRFCRALHTA